MRPERPLRPHLAQAGVDIDAGNRMVELIKPLVRATAGAGADAEIGGFGGLFDLARPASPIRCSSPPPMASAPRSGSPSRPAWHDTIGIDLVAMSVNDLVVQGAEPLSSSIISPRRLDPEAGARIVAGIAEGCRQAGCALIGGETAEMPGLYAAATTTSPASRSAQPNAARCCRARRGAGRRRARPGLVRRAFQRLFAGPQDRRASGPRLGRAGAVRPGQTLGEALLTPTRIYVKPCLARDPGDRRGQGAGPYHRRRLSR